jgi:isopenicillin-N N-acyltransferase-like protein
MRYVRSAATAACLVVLLVGMLAVIGHVAILSFTRVDPPHIDRKGVGATEASSLTRAGLREVFLRGTPEAIGMEHAQALVDRMSVDEGALWGEYERRVPSWLTRVGLLDWGRLRFRALDLGIPYARRRELAGEALGFVPDPFAGRMETYQRLLFLYSLYDMSLPLERSPLIGCTTFALDGDHTVDGHALVGRTFDFEAGDWFDRDKVVFFVLEKGAIPFASVGWPGFLGVVTGMNSAGVLVVVHGARAGVASTDGMPVAFSLREVLSRSHDTPEALDILRAQNVLVSHVVFVADAQGRFAVVERAPGMPAFVRETRSNVAVTNHFEGPLATDPANVRVEQTTTTLDRRARADELLSGVAPRSATPASALAFLRDHACSADPQCPPGDRRAIDAGIATHGVIADTTARVLWVSAGPHLAGHFVRLDVSALLAANAPSGEPEPETMP